MYGFATHTSKLPHGERGLVRSGAISAKRLTSGPIFATDFVDEALSKRWLLDETKERGSRQKETTWTP